MPRRWTTNANGGACERYEWPCRFIAGDDAVDTEIRELRRKHVGDQAIFATLRKASDGAEARTLKDAEKTALRFQRACTLMLPWLGQPDKAQTAIRPSLWPIELSRELDSISSHLLLRFG